MYRDYSTKFINNKKEILSSYCHKTLSITYFEMNK